jgi:hypothetical protein
MNRFDRDAGKASSRGSHPRSSDLSAAEYRFRMIRRIKARVRAERALGLSDDQIIANTKAVQEREQARILEEAALLGRELAQLALRATADALAECSPAPVPAPSSPSAEPFARWLAETINVNSTFIPMKVVQARTASKPGGGERG